MSGRPQQESEPVESEAGASGPEPGRAEVGGYGSWRGSGRGEYGRAPVGDGDEPELGGSGGGGYGTAGPGVPRTGGADGREHDGSVGGRSGKAERGGARARGGDESQLGGPGFGGYGKSGGAEWDGARAGGGDESAARRIALDALSRAARTRGQLEALLQRKGIAPEAAAAVLDRFEEVGLIDDLDYAETFVESRHRVRGQGGRALSMELRRRGVAGEVIAEAVGGLDPEREFETACRIARSRYERMSAVPPEVKVRRLAGFLARKGYSGAIVSRAVRHVVDTADSAAVEALDGMGEDGGGIVDDGFVDDGDGKE